MNKKCLESIKTIKIKYWLCNRKVLCLLLSFLTSYCAQFPNIILPDADSPDETNKSTTPAPMISANGEHTCILKKGKVACWGDGSLGRLGYGNTNNIGDNESPLAAAFVDVGAKVKQITTGEDYSCALLTNGNVRCWGYGANGRLGYANTDNIGDDESPASAGDVNVGGEVKQISASYAHSCALLTNGNVRCWGWGAYGRLGYGNTDDIGDNESPASAGDVNVGGTVKQIALGTDHSCALLTNGNVRCWGKSNSSGLGYANTDNIGDDESPASAGDVDLGGPVKEISAGQYYTCALLTSGSVRCWGSGTYGRLGYSNTNDIGDNEMPSSAGDVNIGTGSVKSIASGGRHSCVLLTGGNVRCWGYGADGRLGYSNTNNIGDNESPVSAGNVNIGFSVQGLAMGKAHSCVLLGR